MGTFSLFLRGFLTTLAGLALLGVVLFLVGVIARPDVPWAVFVGVAISLIAGAAHATIKRQ